MQRAAYSCVDDQRTIAAASRARQQLTGFVTDSASGLDAWGFAANRGAQADAPCGSMSLLSPDNRHAAPLLSGRVGGDATKLPHVRALFSAKLDSEVPSQPAAASAAWLRALEAAVAACPLPSGPRRMLSARAQLQPRSAASDASSAHEGSTLRVTAMFAVRREPGQQPWRAESFACDGVSVKTLRASDSPVTDLCWRFCDLFLLVIQTSADERQLPPIRMARSATKEVRLISPDCVDLCHSEWVACPQGFHRGLVTTLDVPERAAFDASGLLPAGSCFSCLNQTLTFGLAFVVDAGECSLILMETLSQHVYVDTYQLQVLSVPHSFFVAPASQLAVYSSHGLLLGLCTGGFPTGTGTARAAAVEYRSGENKILFGLNALLCAVRCVRRVGHVPLFGDGHRKSRQQCRRCTPFSCTPRCPCEFCQFLTIGVPTRLRLILG